MRPDDIALMHRLADAAGAVIRPYSRSRLAVDHKTPDQPVTEADRAAEQAIRDLLRAERPEDGIIGEELGRHNPDADYVWVIDPIDGTKAFITGKPLFTSLIGLAHRGAPVLGVVDQPVLRERWIGGVEYPTQFNGEQVSTWPCKHLADAYFNTTSPMMFTGAEEAPYRALTAKVKHANYGGDAYAYALLASGFIDIVMETKLQYYDFAALVPIIMAAGGVMTDWAGRPLDAHSAGQVLAAGDPALHQQALALIA